MIEFVLPQTTGEWLAWLVAFSCLIVGLCLMLLPKKLMIFVGMGDSTESTGALSEIRGPFAGAFVGIGLAAILFAQPLVYAALGLMLFFMVVGRFLGFLLDRSLDRKRAALTIAEAIMAYFPLAYAFGIIP